MKTQRKTAAASLAPTGTHHRRPSPATRTAVDVERHLIWTYQRQAADRVVARFISRTSPSWYGSNLAAVLRHGLLGARIDGGGAAAGDLDPDAEATHDAVCALGGEVAGLLILHARAGSRPEWIAEEPRLVAKRRGGKVVMEYWDRWRKRPSHCLLELQPDPQTVAMRREVYVLWWDGLAGVVAALAGRLAGFEVRGPSLPRTPWLG